MSPSLENPPTKTICRFENDTHLIFRMTKRYADGLQEVLEKIAAPISEAHAFFPEVEAEFIEQMEREIDRKRREFLAKRAEILERKSTELIHAAVEAATVNASFVYA